MLKYYPLTKLIPNPSKIGFILAITLSCIACDQFSKHLAMRYLQPLGPVSYFYDTFRLQYTENTGALLSLGESLPAPLRFWLFIVVVFFLLTAILIYAYRVDFRLRYKIAGLSLIAGGGLSNLMDRIANNGAVVDFMNMGIGALRTGIFNVADFLILVGISLALIFHNHRIVNSHRQ